MSTIVSTRERTLTSKALGFEPGPVQMSWGASTAADAIIESLKEIERHQNWDRPSVKSVLRERQGVEGKSLQEQLFDALAHAKVLTSRVAMHLEQDWRTRLFDQLDDLLDVDDWHEDDKPIKGMSFETFLRMIIYQAPNRRPGLGLTHDGNLIAAWTSGTDRLTLEFLPGDKIRWVLSCDIDGAIERAAGDTFVRRLPEVLSPYHPDRWFSDGAHQRST